MIFLDTSAIYALADAADPRHGTAKECLAAVLEADDVLLTHNYILVESLALLQARLGQVAAIQLTKDAHAFEIQWVDEQAHREADRRFQSSGRRKVSFVDQVSFLVMRQRRVTTAFAFDDDFLAAGFELVED